MVTKARTSHEAAEQIIEEFKTSGLNCKAFCESRSINVSTFQWWIKRARNKNVSKEQSVQSFVQLCPSNTNVNDKSKLSEFIIEFQSGTRLRWKGIVIEPSILKLISSLNNGSLQ